MEYKLKYLEFIQNVITRMNANSFLIKGWVTTIVSALFALAAKDADQRYIFIAWFVIFVFWILDGFYLSQERQYRRLYDHARQLPPEEINFDMNAKGYRTRDTSWTASFFSKTLILFYLMFFAITCIIIYFIFR
jgi:hypothetical protein